MRSEGSDLERETASAGDALHKRIERLEGRLELQRDLARRALDEQTARFVQSIGVVVDYLAARGVVDRDDLRTHVERSFHIVDAGELAGPFRGAIDVYGWLTWAEVTKRWSEPRPFSWSGQADPGPSGSGTGIGTGSIEPDLEIGPGRDT
ncbi:hypothetical protein [Methylobacterium durans]|uniref:hypothetical protein n=1 Tax=Methylobacterium durans TaxID=2202825 RepID=UPI0013A5AAF7|nr:hypothetical protein [Methylobacterium durans]